MIEKALRRFEDFAWRGRRFIWYPEDVRIVRRGDHQVGAEDVTPWVWEDAAVVVEDETPPDPLDMDKCWRDGCGRSVPRTDDVGLCRPCREELRAL